MFLHVHFLACEISTVRSFTLISVFNISNAPYLIFLLPITREDLFQAENEITYDS